MPAFDPARWQAVRRLLAEGRERPAADRAAWLASVDDDFRADVAALLAAEARARPILDRPAADTAPDLLAEGDDAFVGRRVGPWRLDERLGEGGMGVVFRATRADADFEQEAALKLVGRGLAPRALVDRFRQERRILARLAHPHIARLLDGGLSEDGQPYFAMERVEGEPLTAYAEARDLGLDARLGLVLDVCAAVAHAHRHLVVHRDLKPSNVVVANGDRGEADVKLLDFGIAKLLSDDDDATVTRTGPFLTPAYAAPEQVTGEPVTTATDVYALGVLLYELLAGRRPYAVEPGATMGAIEKAVCETVPDPPSAVAPASRARRLRGDLDTITLKALEKEPDRRYPSAEALADDLRRHLDGLPITARRATRAYRLQSFVRRHPLGVGLSTVAVLALLLGLAGTTWQARVAAAERDRARTAAATAEQTADFLRGLFEAADPYDAAAEGDTLTARTLLLRGADRLRTDLADQPAVRAALLREIGTSLIGLGQFPAADSLLAEAAALERAHLGADAPALAATLYQRSLVLDFLADYDGSMAAAREALAIRRRALPPADPDLGQSLDWMATVLEWAGEADSAEAMSREAVALLDAAVPPTDGRSLQAHHNLGWILLRHGREADAARVLDETVARTRAARADHLELAQTLNELGRALRRLDRLDEAEAAYREALGLLRARLGPTHADVATSLNNLATLLVERGALDEAEARYRDALAILRARKGADHPDTGVVLAHLAGIARQRGRLAEAERLAREALALHVGGMPEGHSYTASSQVELGRVLLARGRAREAAPLLRAALAAREAQYGADHEGTAEARDLLAEAAGG